MPTVVESGSAARPRRWRRRLAVAAAGILVVVLLLPDHFTVDGRVSIDAPPTKVFELLGNLRKWPEWYPRLVEESAAGRATLVGTGPAVGSSVAWSHPDTGPIQIILLESDGQRSLVFSVMMHGDMLGQVRATVEPRGSGSEVLWHYRAPATFNAFHRNPIADCLARVMLPPLGKLHGGRDIAELLGGLRKRCEDPASTSTSIHAQ